MQLIAPVPVLRVEHHRPAVVTPKARLEVESDVLRVLFHDKVKGYPVLVYGGVAWPDKDQRVGKEKGKKEGKKWVN